VRMIYPARRRGNRDNRHYGYRWSEDGEMA
jgi:hypothetical protein